ncbi:putative iron-sulfur cluster-binding metallochaperone [Sulfuriferula nivalis]|uniref:CopZ zinc binding domain-containing protein n=1 Tax=Sulfuriferula nivalis TaxID=2675298 RepID=A0A809RG65_9PROT|nr:hypothetical protein [Sulfuriferula nivalis]BBP00636.1 hypothetical protein SFSGTM_13440 [Sulfuriferula nivalis]
MSECCATSRSHKLDCPYCQQPCSAVGVETLCYHLKQPWQWQANEHVSYYFCDHKDCAVIYFSDKGETWQQAELRTHVGVKQPEPDALVCYCFGVHYAEANVAARDYVIAQTKSGSCACTTHNPSGRCCLKDFPR